MLSHAKRLFRINEQLLATLIENGIENGIKYRNVTIEN